MLDIKLNYDKLVRGWYSFRRASSYGRTLYCITGKRSTGKSTSLALWVICEYYRTRQGWIYTRRTKDTTDATAPEWFFNAVNIINAHYDIGLKIEYRGGYYYLSDKSDIIDDETEDMSDEPRRETHIAGRAIALSMQQKYKGANLCLYDWLIYDEFVAFSGESYLGARDDILREYRALLSLAQTMDRGVGQAHRGAVHIVCLGNCDSYYSPIYMGIGADRYLRSDTRILAPKGVDWLVQQLSPEDSPSAEGYETTALYRLADDRTRAYAYENRAREESEDFIDKNVSRKTLTPLCECVFDGFHMIIYQYADGLYITPGTQPGLRVFALTHADHTPDYHLVDRYDGYEILQLRVYYGRGLVRFHDRQCKRAIDTYFKFLK